MTTELTHAHLPAARVIEACKKALQDVAESRAAILNSIINNKRSREWPWPKRSYAVAARLLTDEERSIAKFHRAQEENRLEDIMALAQAAMADDPSFRVYVTATDFVFLRPYYSLGV